MAAVKDRDRPLQALSLKRIIKAVEDHWDEPTVLAGVVHELRFRLEPEAAFQARSIARRLSTLHYQLSHDAARVAEESRAAADAIAVLPAPADEDAETEEEETKPRSRRRWLMLGAAGTAAALLAAAWLLRPEAKTIDASNPAGPGLAVTASGGAAPLQSQTSTARPSSSFEREPPRRVAVNEKPSLAPVVRGRSARDDAGLPDALTGDPPPAADETRGDPSFRSPAVRDELAAAAVFERPERPPMAALHGEVSSEPLATAPAEAGVHVTEAAVDCYVSDRNPEHCGGSLATTPAAEGDAARDSGQTANAGAIDPVDAGAPARLPSLGVPRLSPPAGEHVSGPARPTSPLFVAATPPAAIGGKKDAAAPPQCVGSPPMGRIVFVLDGTLSMGLPLDVDGAFEDQLDDAISRHDAAARRQYRALLAEPGPKRITRAREAFTAAAQDLPDRVDLGLVVFQECRDVRKVGTFEAARRGRAIDYIRSLIPHGRTPIAAGLRRAAEMLGEGPSSIVLLTDGRESCADDPCAAAAEIHRTHPDTPVYVVDITGQAKAECVAEITGGKTYTPAAADDLAEVLHNAFRGTDAQCSRAPD